MLIRLCLISIVVFKLCVQCRWLPLDAVNTPTHEAISGNMHLRTYVGVGQRFCDRLPFISHPQLPLFICIAANTLQILTREEIYVLCWRQYIFLGGGGRPRITQIHEELFQAMVGRRRLHAYRESVIFFLFSFFLRTSLLPLQFLRHMTV